MCQKKNVQTQLSFTTSQVRLVSSHRSDYIAFVRLLCCVMRTVHRQLINIAVIWGCVLTISIIMSQCVLIKDILKLLCTDFSVHPCCWLSMTSSEKWYKYSSVMYVLFSQFMTARLIYILLSQFMSVRIRSHISHYLMLRPIKFCTFIHYGSIWCVPSRFNRKLITDFRFPKVFSGFISKSDQIVELESYKINVFITLNLMSIL